jgi:hypothetical protein
MNYYMKLAISDRRYWMQAGQRAGLAQIRLRELDDLVALSR